jgi:predicted nucleotidyltransferase
MKRINISVQKRYRKPITLFTDRVFSKHKENIKKLIIFGSVARGVARSDSDIDIFVIWKGNKLDGWHSLESIAFNILLETGVYISLKIVTPSEHQRMLQNNDHFLKTISREGINIAS